MSKKEGKIFTPKEIVCFMIDVSGYIPGYNIIDSSCGDGNILSEIVKRNIEYFPKDKLKYELENHIHGVEIEKELCNQCVDNLNGILRENNIDLDIDWDIRCGNSLSIRDFDGKMDFCIANPPYIRTRDIVIRTDDYEFMKNGMSDTYLAFFELGFKQLNDNGKMVYIAPSSWYTSSAAQNMRNYILKNRNLSNIWDFCHRQVFENAQTYVSITSFQKGKNFGGISFSEVEVSSEKKIRTLNTEIIPYEEVAINNNFYFGTRDSLRKLKNILSQGKPTTHIKAKNGYATLCDEVFIGNFEMESDYIIPVVKSSTGKYKTCIYPYTKEGKTINEDSLKISSPSAYKWLSSNKDRLLLRKTTEPWYAFGRTQGLIDTWKKKFIIKSIVKSACDIVPKEINAGTGVYGGLYIVVDDEKYLDICQEMLDDNFLEFVKTLRKYKSGGYYTFSTKDFNAYATYYLKNKKHD